jgi:hypothetical protein
MPAMPNDYEGPPTARLICECGYEGPVNIDLRGGRCSVSADAEDEPYWTGKCPECRAMVGSETHDECPTCHAFGGDRFTPPGDRNAVCESCYVEACGLDPRKEPASR